jgi:hypothetical protein
MGTQPRKKFVVVIDPLGLHSDPVELTCGDLKRTRAAVPTWERDPSFWATNDLILLSKQGQP